ncbi:MAG: sigma-70 family RNA polymerase sigma factor, partial [Alicyclobacillus sp.]|nr:sigma-70 family RNA polymerase sigma factor [Alicyclobacillus sp.]
QEAFLKAYRSIRGLKSEEYALPWLMRIVINECRTYLRRTRREVIMVDPPDLASTSAESEYFRTWDQRRVFRAVMGLPEKYRVPVYLFYVEGMATQEIADVLRIRPGTVRVRLLRGRRLLQRRLSEEDVCRLEEQGGEEIQNEDERGVARDDRPGSAVGGAHSPGGGLLPLSHRR